MIYFATLRGVPQFYYGTEIGMKNELPGHGQIRSDFPGGWPGDTVNGFTGEGLSPTELEMKNFTSTLLNWRKESEVIHSGKLMQFAPVAGVYSYFRYNDAKIVMVLFNKNKEATEQDLSKYEEILSANSKAFDVLQQKEIELSESLLLPAKSGMILVFDKE